MKINKSWFHFKKTVIIKQNGHATKNNYEDSRKKLHFETSPVNFQVRKVVIKIMGIKIVVAKTKPS